MSLDDIARLPVEAVAAEDCHLFFWVTGPFLVTGAHIPIMRAWGFEPMDGVGQREPEIRLDSDPETRVKKKWPQ